MSGIQVHTCLLSSVLSCSRAAGVWFFSKYLLFVCSWTWCRSWTCESQNRYPLDAGTLIEKPGGGCPKNQSFGDHPSKLLESDSPWVSGDMCLDPVQVYKVIVIFWSVCSFFFGLVLLCILYTCFEISRRQISSWPTVLVGIAALLKWLVSHLEPCHGHWWVSYSFPGALRLIL